MSLHNKILHIFLNAIPLIIMIGLIPFITSDIFLTGVYLVIIGVALIIQYREKDWLFLVFGFCALTLSEYFFVSTGVETFVRRSLFGVIPLWLPVLWAYAFVAMRRAIVILDK